MLVILDYSKVFFYYEPNFFLFIGKLGSFKFKADCIVYCKFFSGALSLMRSILSVVLFCYNNLLATSTSISKLQFLMCEFVSTISGIDCVVESKFTGLIANVVSSVIRGWNKRLRFVGIGYKVYSFYNLLIFKLGYCHYIIYLLPYELRFSFFGRKRRNLILFGIHKSLLAAICSCIISLRLPNVYTGKGVRLRGVVFKRKEGKKSQF